MSRYIGDWAPVLVLIAALVGSWVTRRNAKDTSVIGGFTALAAELRSELSEAKTAIRFLEQEEKRHATLARTHQRWDDTIAQELRRCSPESVIPDPPPLD